MMDHQLSSKPPRPRDDADLACKHAIPAKERASSKPAQSGPTIERVEGDLLCQDVDAIVNAWNRNFIPYWLLVTQGVSGAIKRAAGTEPFKELRKFGVLALGAARLTSAGVLSDKFKGIIHVAGINHAWRSSEESIRKSVRNALLIAAQQRFDSVALPAIGAGSGGVWGISEKRSLAIINDEASRSEYSGRVVIVKFKREKAERP